MERCGIDRVQAARARRSDRREAVVAQDLEVLRYRGLGDAELGADRLSDLARAQLAVGEELEDPPSDRVTEDIERVHNAKVKAPLI